MTEPATVETPIENVSLNALLAMQDIATAGLIQAKFRAGAVAAELQRRFGESAKQALKEAGKTHGAISLPLQDGLVAKAEAKQTVSWDSAALQAIAQTLPWDRVAGIFKIEFSMTETMYKGVAVLAPDLRAQIDAARTTKIGEPVVKLAKAA